MKKQGVMRLGCAAFAAVVFLFTAAATYAAQPGSSQAAIPIDRLGAEIDQRYGHDSSLPVATAGGYKLAAKMQALEAEVTATGLTVTSPYLTPAGYSDFSSQTTGFFVRMAFL